MDDASSTPTRVARVVACSLAAIPPSYCHSAAFCGNLVSTAWGKSVFWVVLGVGLAAAAWAGWRSARACRLIGYLAIAVSPMIAWALLMAPLFLIPVSMAARIGVPLVTVLLGVAAILAGRPAGRRFGRDRHRSQVA